MNPLDTRGWALQERVLSLRGLIYGTKTLRWSCLSRSPCDSELHYPKNRNLAYVSRGAALFYLNQKVWPIIVEQYTTRQLTFAGDKLIALAGVAERYASVTCQNPGGYLAGLWQDNINTMWLWYYENTSDNYRSRPYRAPSWSWASINSKHPVKFEFKILEGIVETGAVPRLPNMPYGDAKSGFLKLECKIAWFILKRDKETSQLYLIDKEENDKNVFKGSYYFVVLDSPRDDFLFWANGKNIVHRVWLVLSFMSYVSDNFGILLKRVHGTTNTYSRVGVCKVSRCWKEDGGLFSIFDRTEPRTIIIQ